MADWRRDIERALTGLSVRVRYDEPLARHTTLRIGGPARVWLELADEAALAAALSFCTGNGIPWWVLGRGSNVLISDQGLAGVVFHLVGEFARVTIGAEPGKCSAGAGATLDDIADAAEAAELAGFEFMAGIPGTLGGGLWTNAGAFGRSLGDVVEELYVVEPEGGYRRLTAPELERGYRRPVYGGNGIAVRALLRAPTGVASAPGACAETRRRRRAKQPAGHSAGSFFKNPAAAAAGRLIEQCGLKGRRVRAAAVSDRHANFLLNTGGARFADMYELVQAVKANVEAETGIVLEEEVQVLPREKDEPPGYGCRAPETGRGGRSSGNQKAESRR